MFEEFLLLSLKLPILFWFRFKKVFVNIYIQHHQKRLFPFCLQSHDQFLQWLIGNARQQGHNALMIHITHHFVQALVWHPLQGNAGLFGQSTHIRQFGVRIVFANEDFVNLLSRFKSFHH